MINSKNYTFLLIPYLTISCSLYHMTYWSMFGLNGLSFLSVQDIIKASIQPLILSIIFTLLGFYLTSKLFQPKKKISESIPNKEKEHTITKAILLFVIYAVFFYIKTLFTNKNNGAFISFFLSLIILSLIDTSLVFDFSFKTKIDKRFLLLLVIYFPLNSIGIAFDDAYLILSNKSYKYSTINIIDAVSKSIKTDTIKFLSTNDKNFVFISNNNDKIFFIKSDTVILSIK